MDYKEESLLFGFQKFGKWSDTFSFNPKLLQVAEKLQTRRYFFFFYAGTQWLKPAEKPRVLCPSWKLRSHFWPEKFSCSFFNLDTSRSCRWDQGVIPTLRPQGTRAAPCGWIRRSAHRTCAFPPHHRSVSAAQTPPRAHLWAAVLASSTPAPCIHVRTAFMPATMGSSFILLPLLWMLSWMPNIKTHLCALSVFFSLSLFYVSLSSSPGFPPFLSFAPSPGLPFSCDCLIALSPEQSGAVYFTWCLDARVPLKVNKRCDMQKGKKGSCQHPGLQQRLMSATPQE